MWALIPCMPRFYPQLRSLNTLNGLWAPLWSFDNLSQSMTLNTFFSSSLAQFDKHYVDANLFLSFLMLIKRLFDHTMLHCETFSQIMVEQRVIFLMSHSATLMLWLTA